MSIVTDKPVYRLIKVAKPQAVVISKSYAIIMTQPSDFISMYYIKALKSI